MRHRDDNPHLTTSRVGLWQLLDALAGIGRASDDLDAGPSVATIAFQHDTRASYAPTDVARCSTDHSSTAVVSTSALGLLGAESVLPYDITESVVGADDTEATSDVFDVFHSRLMQLVHAAWRRFGPDGPDTLRQGLRSLVGEDPFFAEVESVGPGTLFGLGLSDVVQCNPEYVDLAGFETLLRRAFPELAARVSLGAAVFVSAEAADRPPLGLGQNLLGAGFTYGRGAWDPVGTLRITTREFQDLTPLLPGGETYDRLSEFASSWVPRCTEVELDVPVAGGQAAWLRLDGGRGTVLGFDSQVTSRPPQRVRMRVKVVSAANRLAVEYVHDE